MRAPAARLDQAALERLYSRLERPIYNVVHRSLWSVQDSQDVVHEAFVRLWDMRDRVDMDTVEPLVWKIALNLASKRRRWLRVRRFFGLEGAASRGERVDDTLSAHADRARVRAAVEGLPDDLRDVVMLTAFSELSYDEVAQLLGIASGTVGSRRNKALRLLRAELGEWT